MDPQMPNQMGRQRSNSNYTSLEMSLSFNSTQINVHVRNVDNNVDGGRNANQIWRQQHQPQPPPPPPPPSPNRNAAAPTAAHQHPPPYGLVWMNPFSNPAASAAHQYGYSLPPTATFCCCCRCHCGNQNPQPQGTTRRRCATCGTTHSPQWRTSPGGHMILCNACRIIRDNMQQDWRVRAEEVD